MLHSEKSYQKMIRIITPDTSRPGIYNRIWRGVREGQRISDVNICHKCRHQIMLLENDRKRIISRMSSHHVHVYYHGEPCHVCNQICGEFLVNGESNPI